MHWCSISPIGSKPGPMFVRGEITDENNNYLLEIGNGCTADSELLALMVLAPEIREYLESANTPIAKMLLEHWGRLTRDLHRDQRQPDPPAEKAG
ncbi:MAG: hypothetical protein EBZ69_00915 [Alphaproteobacteria bacterium]|nr:hypothetical protein [Alphaproteobacteria bacterium]